MLAEEGRKCGEGVHVGGAWLGRGCPRVGSVDQAVSHQHELYLMKFLVTSFYLRVGISKSTTMTFSVIILFFFFLAQV